MSVKKRVNALESCGGSTFGCLVKNGELIPAFTGEAIYGKYPQNAKFSFYSTAIDRLYVCTDDAVYVYDGSEFGKICAVEKNERVYMIEFRDKNGAQQAVAIGNMAYLYSGKEFDSVSIGVYLSCGVMHCGRLFGADAEDGLVLRWSGTDGIGDWNEGLHGSGCLKLDPARGAILNLLVFGGKIVAVREYGLTVLSMYGSPERFSVRLTDTVCDRIYKDTVRSVYGKLYFYSLTGLKCFDGAKISPVDTGYPVSEPVSCTDYAGKYFIAGKNSDIGDVILCVNLQNGESCLTKAHADTLFSCDGVYYDSCGNLYKIVGGGSYFFESRELDFGTGKLKTVTGIDVRGTADITIRNGRTARFFPSASGIIRPRMRGAGFIVEAEGKTALKGLTLTAEVSGEI